MIRKRVQIKAILEYNQLYETYLKKSLLTVANLYFIVLLLTRHYLRHRRQEINKTHFHADPKLSRMCRKPMQSIDSMTSGYRTIGNGL